jgi:predicted SnoaL-like aldol condensation-catalyzing enzyme
MVLAGRKWQKEWKDADSQVSGAQGLQDISKPDIGIFVHDSGMTDGKYALQALFLERVAVDSSGPAASFLHIMLKSKDGETYTMVDSVPTSFRHLLEETKQVVGMEVEVRYGVLCNSDIGILRREPWSWANTASSKISGAVRWQNRILDAIGLNRLSWLEADTVYRVDDVSITTDLSVDGMRDNISLVVGLTVLGRFHDMRVMDATQEKSAPKVKLIMQFNPATYPAYENRIRATRFFYSMMGKNITPAFDMPTLIEMDDTDTVVAATAANCEPKLKAGELYILDEVEKQHNSLVVLKLHKVDDTGNSTSKNENANVPYVPLRRENVPIEIKILTYADNFAAQHSEALRKTRDDIYSYFYNMLSVHRYYDHEVVTVAPVRDIHEGALDFMDIPEWVGGPSQRKLLEFKMVKLFDFEGLERARKNASRFMGKSGPEHIAIADSP